MNVLTSVLPVDTRVVRPKATLSPVEPLKLSSKSVLENYVDPMQLWLRLRPYGNEYQVQ